MNCPQDQDHIKEKEILVVSFGSADREALTEDIGGIERALQDAYPAYDVQRAFTSDLSIRRIWERGGVRVDSLEEALQRAVQSGVRELCIVPTHLVHAEKYEDVIRISDKYASHFDSLSVSEPLLGEVPGAESPAINERIVKTVVALTADIVEMAGYDSLRTAAADGTAIVLVGHGTGHVSGEIYLEMQDQIDWLGYENVYVGTIAGEPEQTDCRSVMQDIYIAGYEKVILRPLLVAVGKHAREDIAGENEDSWLRRFKDSEAFDSVIAQTAGLGRVKAIRELYVQGACISR